MDETPGAASRGASATRGSEQASDPTPEVVAQRLTGQFATAYLTLASIIQGVALTTLVSRVEAAYSGFTAADWVLTVTTFLVILIVWQEYLLQALAYVWLPTVLDSLVPFGFVVAEIFLAHLVYHTERAWLVAYGGFYLMGVAAWSFQNRQIGASGDEESRRIDRFLAPHDRLRGALLIIFAALSLAAWALYDVLGLGRAPLGVAFGALAGVCVFVGRSVPAWERLRAYARGGWHGTGR